MLHALSMACTPGFLDGFGVVISCIPYSGTIFHFIHNGFPVSIFFRGEEIDSLTSSVIAGDILGLKPLYAKAASALRLRAHIFYVFAVGKLVRLPVVLPDPMGVVQGATSLGSPRIFSLHRSKRNICASHRFALLLL